MDTDVLDAGYWMLDQQSSIFSPCAALVTGRVTLPLRFFGDHHGGVIAGHWLGEEVALSIFAR